MSILSNLSDFELKWHELCLWPQFSSKVLSTFQGIFWFLNNPGAQDGKKNKNHLTRPIFVYTISGSKYLSFRSLFLLCCLSYCKSSAKVLIVLKVLCDAGLTELISKVWPVFQRLNPACSSHYVTVFALWHGEAEEFHGWTTGATVLCFLSLNGWF